MVWEGIVFHTQVIWSRYEARRVLGTKRLFLLVIIVLGMHLDIACRIILSVQRHLSQSFFAVFFAFPAAPAHRRPFPPGSQHASFILDAILRRPGGVRTNGPLRLTWIYLGF